MSEAGWLTIIGFVVAAALAFCGTVFALIGHLLHNDWREVKGRISVLESRERKKMERLIYTESYLEKRGMQPMKEKYPSPPLTIEDGAG